MSGVLIVTVHIENQQSVYGDVYLEKKIELSTRDHAIVGLYSILIYCAVKYAMFVSSWAWILVWLNVWFFDVYAYTRKHAQK